MREHQSYLPFGQQQKRIVFGRLLLGAPAALETLQSVAPPSGCPVSWVDPPLVTLPEGRARGDEYQLMSQDRLCGRGSTAIADRVVRAELGNAYICNTY